MNFITLPPLSFYLSRCSFGVHFVCTLIADFQTAYFIVYAAQFLRSAHGANFVAVLVHILGILDMIGSFALYPAKAGDIDHIRQFIIVSYWLRCRFRFRLRGLYRDGICLRRRYIFLFCLGFIFYFRYRDGQLLGGYFRG